MQLCKLTPLAPLMRFTFPDRCGALAFARAWSRLSRRGYSISATAASGETVVSLDGLTEKDRSAIECAFASLSPVSPNEAREILAGLAL
jgi:hypothetical protein